MDIAGDNDEDSDSNAPFKTIADLRKRVQEQAKIDEEKEGNQDVAGADSKEEAYADNPPFKSIADFRKRVEEVASKQQADAFEDREEDHIPVWPDDVIKENKRKEE